MSNSEVTPVMFRVWQDKGDAEVFALFPADFADNYGDCCSSYQHIGQHCAANYHYCIQHSRPAKSEEYANLKIELERIGYILQVIQRASPQHHEKRRRDATALRVA